MGEKVDKKAKKALKAEGAVEKKIKKQKTDKKIEEAVVESIPEVKKIKKAKKEAKGSADSEKKGKKGKKDKKKAEEEEEEEEKMEEEAPAAEAEEEEEETAEPEPTFKIHKKAAPVELEDQTMTCRDCSGEFIFTVGQQEFFKQKGFDNVPTRCKDCTAAKKARFNEGGNSGGGKWGGDKWGGDAGPTKCYNCGGTGHMSRECTEPKKAMACYNCGEEGHQSRNCPKADGSAKKASGVCFAFQKGQCSRGDQCRFSHTSE
eukprot:6123930-Pleurochrysis_carterae.AAC.3